MSASDRSYYARNSDAILAKRKAYQASNAKKIAAQRKAFREKNRAYVLERSKRYYGQRDKVLEAARAGKRRAACRAWGRANRAKLKAWNDAHREELRAYWRQRNKGRLLEMRITAANRRARQYGRKLSREIVQTLMALQHGRCAACACELLRHGYHIDHIVALCNGGAHADQNVQLLCPPCNLKKGRKDDAAFRRSLERGHLNRAPDPERKVPVADAGDDVVGVGIEVDSDLPPLRHVAWAAWQTAAHARHLAPLAISAEHLDRAVGVHLEPTLPVAGA